MEKINLTESLKKLEEINDWFDQQSEVDVEEGLAKVKGGIQLVKASKKRLEEVENEFEEVKKELGQDSSHQEDDQQPEPEVKIEDIPF